MSVSYFLGCLAKRSVPSLFVSGKGNLYSTVTIHVAINIRSSHDPTPGTILYYRNDTSVFIANIYLPRSARVAARLSPAI